MAVLRDDGVGQVDGLAEHLLHFDIERVGALPLKLDAAQLIAHCDEAEHGGVEIEHRQHDPEDKRGEVGQRGEDGINGQQKYADNDTNSQRYANIRCFGRKSFSHGFPPLPGRIYEYSYRYYPIMTLYHKKSIL